MSVVAQFPPAGLKEDSSKFKEDWEDKGIKSETDGAYVYARPRHARPPRRIIGTGFTDIDTSQRQSIVSMITQHGTYGVFTYKHPGTGEVLRVRFSEIPKFTYRGYGGNHRYDCQDITLLEV